MVGARDGVGVFGAAALVTGCCIGGGMLGLPLSCASSGFVPSLLPLLVGWAYMYLSGFMILEVYLGVRKPVDLMGLLDTALGRGAKILGAGLFVFLFYLLLTAYFDASCTIIRRVLHGWGFACSTPFCLLLHVVFLFVTLSLRIGKVEAINTALLFGMLAFYVCLLCAGLPKVHPERLLLSVDPKSVVWTFPVFIVSFGFQNLVPTVAHSLHYDIKRIRSALFLGTCVTFSIYLVWMLVILGAMSQGGSGQGSNESVLLGLLDRSGTYVASFIRGFSFFAVITSLLSVALSCVNFLANSFEVRKRRFPYILGVILPPALFSFFNPNLFLTLLHISGGVVAVSLFGLLPVAMVWKTRYVTRGRYPRLIRGGRGMLIGYGCFSCVVIALTVAELTR
ncbi:MAG: hypothetical protein OXF02_05270 [Simkaniaceae bacterium]|nr:hypothetical protein [Simkaniaceae bacterium]